MRIDQIELSGSLFVTSSASIILGKTKISSDNNGSISFTNVNNPTQKVIGSYSGSFTGSIKLPTVPQGAAETNILLVNGSGNVVYRSTSSLFSIFNEEFINTISSTLTFTKNSGVLPTLNLEASIQVYQNGQKLFTNQYTITPPNIITINTDTYYEGSSYSIFVTLIN
jgi:hypothetical protein